MPPRIRALLPTTLLPLVAACASPEVQESRQLPFHIAVLPVETRPIESVSEVEDSVIVNLDSISVTESFVTYLNSDCFARASLLPPPSELQAQNGPDTLESQATLWQDAAKSMNADLILHSTFAYSPDFSSERNEKFWLNLPLFLLGGPFCYFVSDRSYEVSGRLIVTLYDANALSRSARLAEFEVPVTEIQLDFIARAGGSIPTYLASLIIPAGLLARKNEAVKNRVEQDVTENLATMLGLELLQRDDEIVMASRFVNFYLDPQEIELSVIDPEFVQLSCEVVLRKTDEVDSLYEFSVNADNGTERVYEFGEPLPDLERSTGITRYVRYLVDVPIPVTDRSESIHLRVTDSSRFNNERTFTVPLPTRE